MDTIHLSPITISATAFNPMGVGYRKSGPKGEDMFLVDDEGNTLLDSEDCELIK